MRTETGDAGRSLCARQKTRLCDHLPALVGDFTAAGVVGEFVREPIGYRRRT